MGARKNATVKGITELRKSALAAKEKIKAEHEYSIILHFLAVNTLCDLFLSQVVMMALVVTHAFEKNDNIYSLV